jgi:hypothetical protein
MYVEGYRKHRVGEKYVITVDCIFKSVQGQDIKHPCNDMLWSTEAIHIHKCHWIDYDCTFGRKILCKIYGPVHKKGE